MNRRRQPGTLRYRWLLHVLLFALLLSWHPTPIEAATPQSDQAAADTADSPSRFNKRDNYDIYLAAHADASRPEASYLLTADQVSAGEAARILPAPEDAGQAVSRIIETDETGFVEWEFDIAAAGLYQLQLVYRPIPGRGASIERALTINGELPFFNAGHFNFSRVWRDAGPVRRDNRGNDLRPSQIEEPRWETRWLTDYMGYYIEPYAFYFREGRNTLRLTSVREPMQILSLRVTQKEELPTHAERLETYRETGIPFYTGEALRFQAENACCKSDATLYAIADRSSPMTEPYDVSKIRLNAIGGYRWNQPGQWISWRVEVPEDGLYKLAFKARQNTSRGVYSARQLTIDGEIPFAEASYLRFYYSTEWQMYVLGQGKERVTDPNGVTPQLVHLTAGEHEIRLEVVLGEFAEVIRVVEESLFSLNEAYRKIIMLTTTTPDVFRDYRLQREMPEVISELGRQGRIIQETGDRLIAITGERGSQSAILYTLAFQLQRMHAKPDDIPRMLGDFKTNLGALGTWLLTASEKPLELDYILLTAPDAPLPETEAGLLRNLEHEIRSFVASFTEDYSSVGNIYSGRDPDSHQPLTIWIQSGRDQSQVLKQLIDDSFTAEHDIPVNLQIVQAGTLLPAVVAGIGPDVALWLGGGEPVNFASRKAAVDLTQFPDFPEVAERFSPSALTPYSFEGGVYALPETQTFPMLFYRSDILDELGVEVPDTWDEMMEILPVIQKNNLEFGIPVATTAAPESGMMAFLMFLYQRDGDLYSHGGAKSALDREEAIQAFTTWTSLYLNYKLPQDYDFANRFRIGEMPIGITDYQAYNMLTVFAPEIRGLWRMVPVPALIREDGSRSRAIGAWGQNCMMLSDSERRDDAWLFMRWWTSDQVQEEFGREMESLLGAAGRYPTANLQAMSRLPWPVDDYRHLIEQWNSVRGIPEVPGGYYTPRHLNNAFRAVVYSADDPRETLLDYVRDIDDELTAKRNEFGLPVYADLRDAVPAG